MSDAPDTAHSALVTDHKYLPQEGHPWSLCATCGLSSASHKDSDVYTPDAPRATPEEVDDGVVVLQADQSREEVIMDTREEILLTAGHKDDDGKTQWSAMSWFVLDEVAEVMTYGAIHKYDKHNWRKGMQYTRLWDAAQRHMKAWVTGEEADPETGKSHLAHAICCISMLRDLEMLELGTDDRWKGDA